MNDIVHGLILKSMEYREYDSLITVLTKEYGKLTFRAAGSKKMTSRNAGSILPYTEAEISFDYRINKTMFRLKTARTLHLFRHIHEDLEADAAASAVSEIADAFSLEGMHDPSFLYDEVLHAFSFLDQKADTALVLVLYIADIMRENGMEPNVDACVRDGNTRVSAISAEDGGFLCKKCAREEGKKIRSADELRLFRLVVKAGLAHYDYFAEHPQDVRWCLKILEDMLILQGNVHIRSFELYNRITDIR